MSDPSLWNIAREGEAPAEHSGAARATSRACGSPIATQQARRKRRSPAILYRITRARRRPNAALKGLRGSFDLPLTRTRAGASLLEAMAACVCATLFLVPTATMLVDASRWSARMENQTELLSLTEGCVDDIQFQLTSNFRSERTSDSFASKGFRNSRFDATCSDRVVDGGIPGRFMVIDVFTWTDLNSNGTWDLAEPKFEIHTGMARRG